MTTEPGRKPGRPRKYDPDQLHDNGAPKLSIRFDPELFKFLQSRPEGTRNKLEELVRRETSPLRRLALHLALVLRDLPTSEPADLSQKPEELGLEDSVRSLIERSVYHASRLLSFGSEDPDAVTHAGSLAKKIKARMERRALSGDPLWNGRLLSGALKLALATSAFFASPEDSERLAKDGLDSVERAAAEVAEMQEELRPEGHEVVGG